MTTVGFLDRDAAGALTAPLAELVNAAYAAGEVGLWQPGTERILPFELRELIWRGEVAVARRDGRLAGCVRVRMLDATRGELGLLAVARDAAGLGVGRALVDFAEAFCDTLGANAMRLTLLVPRAFEHPYKTYLDGWYTRLGYRVIERLDFAAVEPEPATLLTTPCDLLVYEKPL